PPTPGDPPGEPDLIAAGGHHAQFGASLALDARERAQGGHLDAEAPVGLLDLPAMLPEGVEAVRHAHLLDAQADHAEHQRHREAGPGHRGGHGAKPSAIGGTMAADRLLLAGAVLVSPEGRA